MFVNKKADSDAESSIGLTWKVAVNVGNDDDCPRVVSTRVLQITCLEHIFSQPLGVSSCPSLLSPHISDSQPPPDVTNIAYTVY